MIKYLLLIFLISCTSSKKEDPLKNTKKLIVEGHSTLYHNGAFEVPMTTIKLIPPGPDALALGAELAGLSARQSFLMSLNKAKDSVLVIYDGSKQTYQLSKNVNKEMQTAFHSIGKHAKESSYLIFVNTKNLSGDILTTSWQLAPKVYDDVGELSKRIHFMFEKFADSSVESIDEKIRYLENNKIYIGKEIDLAQDKFILAYSKLPAKLTKNKEKMAEKLSFERFQKAFQKSGETIRPASEFTSYLFGSAFKNYAQNIKKSLGKAKQSLTEEDPEFGYSLSAIKSLAWILDGLFVEGLIRPVGQGVGGGIGYILIQGVAYPVVLVTHQGVVGAEAVVEVVYQTANSTYELTAPSVAIALTSILESGAELSRKGAELSLKSAKMITKGVVSTVDYSTTKTVQYIAAPIMGATATSAVGLSGVAVGVGGMAAAGVSRAVGDITHVSEKPVSFAVSSTVMATGLAAYTVKGVAETVYEVTKATVVPPSLLMGSGIVLTYSTLAHLSAHTILAASDMAYLVLSMEGTQWVIYGIKGKLGDGDNYPEGTILDLDKMKQEGEEIYRIPISEKEINSIMQSY